MGNDAPIEDEHERSSKGKRVQLINECRIAEGGRRDHVSETKIADLAQYDSRKRNFDADGNADNRKPFEEISALRPAIRLETLSEANNGNDRDHDELVQQKPATITATPCRVVRGLSEKDGINHCIAKRFAL